MDCRHLEHIYELFVLGSLAEENSQDLREHLGRGCEYCSARIKEAARTVYLLSLSSKPVSPAPEAKEILLRLVRRK